MEDEVAEELERLEAGDDSPRRERALEITLRALDGDPPVLVAPDVPVHELVHLMKEHQTNAVLVVNAEGSLAGIFTERDLLARVVGRPVDWMKTTVAEVMTRNPESLHPDSTLAYALNYMHVGGYGHVPVVDDERRPVGLVSLKEVVHYLAEAFPQQLSNLPPDADHAEPRARYGA